MTAWAWIGTILAVLAGLWAACAYAIWYERRYLARPPFAGLTQRGALWPLAPWGAPWPSPTCGGAGAAPSGLPGPSWTLLAIWARWPCCGWPHRRRVSGADMAG
jgi:hypothetical protein